MNNNFFCFKMNDKLTCRSLSNVASSPSLHTRAPNSNFGNTASKLRPIKPLGTSLGTVTIHKNPSKNPGTLNTNASTNNFSDNNASASGNPTVLELPKPGSSKPRPSSRPSSSLSSSLSSSSSDSGLGSMSDSSSSSFGKNPSVTIPSKVPMLPTINTVRPTISSVKPPSTSVPTLPSIVKPVKFPVGNRKIINPLEVFPAFGNSYDKNLSHEQNQAKAVKNIGLVNQKIAAGATFEYIALEFGVILATSNKIDPYLPGKGPYDAANNTYWLAV